MAAQRGRLQAMTDRPKEAVKQGNLIEMPPSTFKAKLFETEHFKVAGTLDGFVDLATSDGTYQLSLDEAQALASALNGAIADIKSNCLYDRDALLEKS